MKPIAITTLLALMGVVITPFSAHADEPVRVMIVGDSVTQGADGDHTWRYFAWNSLQGVDFVGPQTSTHEGGGYADPAFDQDHAAQWGRAMWQIVEGSPNVTDLTAAHTPDVVMELLGINDLVWSDPANRDQVALGTLSHAERFVAMARSANPEVDVVLSPLPQTWVDGVPAYNAGLPALAARLTTQASEVVVAPLADFTEGVDTYDHVHPSTEGERKIAASMVEALALLVPGVEWKPEVVEPEPVAPTVEPEPVAPTEPVAPAPAPVVEVESIEPVVPSELAPAAPRQVRAIRKGKRVRVSWQASARAERYLVHCTTKRRSTTLRHVLLRSTANRCRVRAVNDSGASRWIEVRVRRLTRQA